MALLHFVLKESLVVPLEEGKEHLYPAVRKRTGLAGHNSPNTFIKIFPSKPVICLLSTYRNSS